MRRTAALVLAAVFGLLLPGVSSAGLPKYEPAKVKIPELRLFDLGVGDHDADGNLEFFTTNHKFGSTLLEYNPRRDRFVDRYESVGLSPVRAYPGFELLQKRPSFDQQGLYLWVEQRAAGERPAVRLRSVGVEATGSLVFGTGGLEVRSVSGDATADDGELGGSTFVVYEIGDGGEIVVDADHFDLPFTFKADEPLDPALIKVGPKEMAGKSREIHLTLRDRHGIVMADLNEDGLRDMFIVSGGLGGNIDNEQLERLARDEVLIRKGKRFRDRGAQTKIRKGACRGREALAADIDRNGFTDLIATCEEAVANTYLRRHDGTFKRFPGPPVEDATQYRFLEPGGVQLPRLVTAGQDKVEVWKLVRGGVWERLLVSGLANRGRQVHQIAIGDVDDNGELDAHIVSPGGGTIVLQEDGEFRAVPAKRFGLPPKARAVVYVDPDNNGKVDVHTLPDGLYERKSRRKFSATGELVAEKKSNFFHLSWPDFDNDGLREPVIALASQLFPRLAPTEVLHAKGKSGKKRNWLELDLRGPSGNEEAIGAKVRIVTRRGEQFQIVGAGETSRYSQGHYRVYFGLGRAKRVKQLEIRWPNGERTLERRVKANRLLEISP